MICRGPVLGEEIALISVNGPPLAPFEKLSALLFNRAFSRWRGTPHQNRDRWGDDIDPVFPQCRVRQQINVAADVFYLIENKKKKCCVTRFNKTGMMA